MPPHCGINMNEYLKSTFEKLKSGHYSSLHVVLGNESCDLDSAASALALAAFLHWQHQRLKCRVCTRDKRTSEAPDAVFAGVLNVARAEFPLRTEVAHCLRALGLHIDHLVFRDDVSLPGAARLAAVSLVDHHSLPAALAALAPLVEEVIDHRPLDKTGWSFPADTRVTVTGAGSCASLVTQRVAALGALLGARDEFLRADTRIADMLHSTIILDTANFSAELQKGTPLDEEMASFLEEVLGPADWREVRARKLESLVAARADVSALTSAQLLRKDDKVAGAVLVPSLPLLVKEFLAKAEAVEAIGGALARRGCCAAVLLGMQLAGGLRRDAAVYCREDGTREQLISFLQAWKPSFELSAEKLPDVSADASLRYFTQHNLTATRKQYMPAINEFCLLNKLESSKQ